MVCWQKRGIRLTLILALMGFLMSSVVAFAEVADLEFDEEHIVLRFGAISDTHLMAGQAKFEESLRQLYQKAGKNKLDAILVAGDLTDGGSLTEV